MPGIFRKGGRTHVLPLPPLALGLRKDLRPVSGGTPWVFVGRRGASLANNPARWTAFIRRASGLDFGLHDLRRTCATGCARLGASEGTVSRILGHKAIAGTIAVSGIYDRFDRLPEIRAALAAWATYVEALVTGEEKRGELVAFSRDSAGPKRVRAKRRPAPGPAAEIVPDCGASKTASDGDCDSGGDARLLPRMLQPTRRLPALGDGIWTRGRGASTPNPGTPAPGPCCPRERDGGGLSRR